MYDYGARFYDPTVGRFPSIDPIADQFPHLSPFNYASNNPVKNIDLHGLQGLTAPLPGMKILLSEGLELIRQAGEGNPAIEFLTGVATVSIGLIQDQFTDQVDNNTQIIDVANSLSKGDNLDAILGYTGLKGPVSTLKGVAQGDWRSIGVLAGNAALVVLSSKAGGASVETNKVVPKGPGAQGVKPVKRVSSKTLRNQWEKKTGKEWPKENNGNNQSVKHKKALNDGGTNDVENIEPMEWLLHIEEHIKNGDYSRWVKERNKGS